MKELLTILNEFEHCQRSGQRAAIATVVKTRGSVYRRPGARMLLTETGQQVGAISGGCLESDVFERAQPLLHQDSEQDSEPIVVQYDTTASEDVVWGLGLGCNGAVHVLLESLNPVSARCQLEFIADCFQQQQAGAIATVFYVEGEINVRIGAKLLTKSNGKVVANHIEHSQITAYLLQDIERLLASGHTQVVTYTLDNGIVEALIEVIQPPIQLLVFGAGYDAIPLVQLAKQLGWQVTVIDPRSSYLTPERFPDADERIICSPDDLPDQIKLTPRTVAVLMTHHYLRDQALLRLLLPSPIRYLGLLGPKRRSQQLLEDLRTEGMIPTEQQLHRLHAPIGLDIGAETPEEIALAITAEIQAVLSDRSGIPLRERSSPIHEQTDSSLALV